MIISNRRRITIAPERTFERTDGLLSPRAGLIFKPIEPVSVYWNYSLAYVPRAGDQLNALEFDNQSLVPERFINLELGAKWDIRPNLSVTAAAYRLDRSQCSYSCNNCQPCFHACQWRAQRGY